MLIDTCSVVLQELSKLSGLNLLEKNPSSSQDVSSDEKGNENNNNRDDDDDDDDNRDCDNNTSQFPFTSDWYQKSLIETSSCVRLSAESIKMHVSALETLRSVVSAEMLGSDVRSLFLSGDALLFQTGSLLLSPSEDVVSSSNAPFILNAGGGGGE